MLNYILLQAAEGAANPQGGNSWSFWVMMILIFVVFYFFMIRPQTKKQKELQQQRDAMKKGDKVTIPGFGTFSVTERAARMGVNPSNKKKIKIAAKKSGKFKMSKSIEF